MATGYEFYTTEAYKVNDETVRTIKEVYKKLPPGPIDINSKEGKELRQKTRYAGTQNNLIDEVYKGWIPDYQNK